MSENITITPEQFEKLPRYVQAEIKRMDRTINELREHINRLTEPQPAVAFAGAVGSFAGRPNGQPPRPILFDEFDVVRIALTGELASDGSASRGQEYVEIGRRDEGSVYVRISTGRLTFSPEVSNSGWISTERQ